jgi:hypothetical protein
MALNYPKIEDNMVGFFLKTQTISGNFFQTWLNLGRTFENNIADKILIEIHT